MSLDSTYSILEPQDSLLLLLEASVTLITKGSHQRIKQPKKNLLLYFLSKGLYCGCHLRNTAWTRMRIDLLIPCTRYRGSRGM